MNKNYLIELLEKYKSNKITIDEAIDALKNFYYLDIGHTKIDFHRELRKGYPEVIFCAGKTPLQVKEIVLKMLENNVNILATRASYEVYKSVEKICDKAVYHTDAKIITIKLNDIKLTDTYIAIVSAGTSDIPIAEEAAVTAEFFGNKVERIYDVGVAGIHRLYDNLHKIRNARAIIVVAGMEGALPSIVGGLVDKPVIAVPTSIGYGAAFNGLAALLGMLTSCASGVVVVNIDNGFGAAYFASMINKL